MILTSPMAWPLGKLLDKILGNEDFINYSKARFLGLIKQVIYCLNLSVVKMLIIVVVRKITNLMSDKLFEKMI